MSNTKVTITYNNGAVRNFVASDELEELINKGEMFSVTTMHSDMGVQEEMALSKMYVGNPMSALGHMMMMRRNAEKAKTDGEEDPTHMQIVIDVVNSCITFLSEEITSHQSEMSPVMDNTEGTGDTDGCS